MMRVRRAQGGGGADGGELPIKHGGGATEGRAARGGARPILGGPLET
jgi:hypothetical protein